MGITEILLLVVGLGIFVLSFILPEKRARLREADKKFMESQIRKMLEMQMQDVKTRVSDIVDETITYAVDKTERSMERVTNEKIMAVSEYSDTVLEAIHKNHEEVVFLYDMLNDKQQSLKDTVAEIEKRSREALLQFQDAEADLRAGSDKQIITDEVQVLPAAEESQMVPFTQITGIDVIRSSGQDRGTASLPEDGMLKRAVDTGTERPLSVPESKLPGDASYSSSGEDGKNNNEQILALHRLGKSNVAIAKELGLGVGEVRLVIDLLKGV